MLSLYTMLQSWIATPTGMITLAIIFGLGLVIAFFMVVVTVNVHSELKQFNEKYDHDIDALNKTLDSQRGNFESESQKFAASLSDVTKKNELLKTELLETETALTNRTDELKKEREAVQIYQRELAEEGAIANFIRRGTLSLGKLISQFIKTKTVETRTYLVGGGLDGQLNQRILFANVTDAVKGIHPETDIECANMADVFLAAELPTAGSLERATANFYRDALEPLANITPIYYLSILYIRSLDLKLVVTDYNLFTDLSLREPELIAKENHMRDIINSHIRGVIRSNDNVLILTPEFADALGSDFRMVKVFNEWYVNTLRGTVDSTNKAA